MIDLIKRLEAATEGSRELDARIQALNYGEEFDSLAARQVHPLDEFSVVWVGKSGRRYTCWHNLAFTRSLDAALTLIAPPANCYGFDLTPKGVDAYVSLNYVPRGSATWLIEGAAKTAPLAICIAALRARNEEEGRA